MTVFQEIQSMDIPVRDKSLLMMSKVDELILEGRSPEDITRTVIAESDTPWGAIVLKSTKERRDFLVMSELRAQLLLQKLS